MAERCTPFEARWCGIHGDCACTPDKRGGLYRQDCPLHRPDSGHPATQVTEGEDGRSYVDGRAISADRRKVQVILVLALEDDWRAQLGTDPAVSAPDAIGSEVLARLGSVVPRPWTVFAIDVAVTR